MSAARCVVRVGCWYLHRAAPHSTRVQGLQGGALYMISGDATFESVAISDTSGAVRMAGEADRVGGGFVWWCHTWAGGWARSEGSGRCLAGGSDDFRRLSRAYELARQRHGARDVRLLRHRSPRCFAIALLATRWLGYYRVRSSRRIAPPAARSG